MDEQQYQDEYGAEGEYYGGDGDYAENYEEETKALRWTTPTIMSTMLTR